MTFYVNEIIDNLNEFGCKYPNRVVGLFTNNKWNGFGNFCGYYAVEQYLDTDVLAYYVTDKSLNRISGVSVPTPMRYDSIEIRSGLVERKIEAATYDEAIDIFRQYDFKSM